MKPDLQGSRKPALLKNISRNRRNRRNILPGKIAEIKKFLGKDRCFLDLTLPAAISLRTSLLFRRSRFVMTQGRS